MNRSKYRVALFQAAAASFLVAAVHIAAPARGADVDVAILAADAGTGTSVVNAAPGESITIFTQATAAVAMKALIYNVVVPGPGWFLQTRDYQSHGWAFADPSTADDSSEPKPAELPQEITFGLYVPAGEATPARDVHFASVLPAEQSGVIRAEDLQFRVPDSVDGCSHVVAIDADAFETDGTPIDVEMANLTVVTPDIDPPVIQACPPDQTLSVAAGGSIALPNLAESVAAMDTCDSDPLLSRSQTPAAGTDTGSGVHMVHLTVADAAANSAGCTVMVTVSELPRTDGMAVTVGFADENGGPIDNVFLGRPFRINVFAQDLRTTPEDPSVNVGVFSAFADVLYDTALIDATGIVHVFPSGPSGAIDDNAGIVDDVGGASFSRPPNRDPQLVFYIEATAVAKGSLIVTTNAGDHENFAENVLFGVDADQRDVTSYDGSTIAIVDPPPPFRFDFVREGETAAVDVIDADVGVDVSLQIRARNAVQARNDDQTLDVIKVFTLDFSAADAALTVTGFTADDAFNFAIDGNFGDGNVQYFSATGVSTANDDILLGTVTFRATANNTVAVFQLLDSNSFLSDTFGGDMFVPEVLNDVTVNVGDVQSPGILVCAADRTLAVDGNCESVIPDLTGMVSATDNIDTVAPLGLSQSPSASTPVGLGDYVVVFTVNDTAGNTATCSAVVSVLDLMPPILQSCPGTMTIAFESDLTATVPDLSSRITAADNCDSAPALMLSQSPSAGSTFDPRSTITVSLTATDAAGNTAACTVDVQPHEWTHVFALTRGWNLIVIPGMPDAADFAALKASSRGDMWRWTGTAFAPVNSSADVADGSAFWVYFLSDQPPTIRGRGLCAPESLPSGWSLTSWCAADAVAAQSSGVPIWAWQTDHFVRHNGALFPYVGYWILSD